MLKNKVLLVAVLCSVVSLCPLLYGQANGSLSGTVSDKTGSVIAGATVKITSQGTGLTREATTDGSGHYLVPLLPVSVYTIRVESQGFRTTEQKDIRLQVDEQREVNFALNPASVSSTVEVTATEVAVETTNPTLGQVITAEEVADLPLKRAEFRPARDPDPRHNSIHQPKQLLHHRRQQRSRHARRIFALGWRVSRTEHRLACSTATTTISSMKAASRSSPQIDSIQEFKVLTYNYSAEYGERAGPTVLVTTKSGTNQWHGTLFEFFRNTSSRRKEAVYRCRGEIRSQSVWRLGRRSHSEKQDIFLCRLSGQNAA